MEQLLMGAISAGSLFAGLFFYRFWRHTGDRFFLYFAGSFWIEAGNRTALARCRMPTSASRSSTWSGWWPTA